MARTSTAEGAPGLTQDALGKVLVLVLLVLVLIIVLKRPVKDVTIVNGLVRENVGERRRQTMEETDELLGFYY